MSIPLPQSDLVPLWPTGERGRPRGVPMPRTALIGREWELAAVQALQRRDDVPLVTITGPGGAGKTRLALAVAADLAAEFTDGAVFVSLAPVRDPAFVPAAIAQALEIPDSGRLLASLRARNLLLVLDNFEHVLDAAPFVADLLGACPRLTVLCTSRTRLNLAGEHAFPLRSLEPEDAIRLFEQRAQALVPTFAITQTMRPAVTEICARLDGLPLAIELAAARVPVLPPTALLARLHHRLDVLAHGPRDAPDRQRTLRDAIVWSHDLLGDREEVIFRRLAVFVGGFAPDAAEAVAGTGDDLLESLSTLVENSLLNQVGGPDDAPRYTMLETIREFALERLAESGEELEARDRHAEYYLAVAENMWRSMMANPVLDTDRDLRRLYPEHNNLQAALGWLMQRDPVAGARLAGALDEYWFRFGHFAEGRAWLARALGMDAELPPDVRARILISAGWQAYQQGDLSEAETRLAEATVSLRPNGDPHLLHWALSGAGNVALSLGNAEQAGQLFDEALVLASEFGNPLLIATATLDRGRVVAMSSDLPQAQALLEEALTMHRQFGLAYGVAVTLYFLGNVVLAQDDTRRAADCYREALRKFAAATDWTNVARCAEGIARVIAAGRPEAAIRLLGATAAMRDRLGHPVDREDQPAHERALADTRKSMTEEHLAAAWATGQAQSWDDLLTEATTVATAFLDEHDTPPEPAFGLTEREREVLALLVEGNTDAEIAVALFISPRTTATHVRHIYDKLGVSSRAAAAAWAVRNGLA